MLTNLRKEVQIMSEKKNIISDGIKKVGKVKFITEFKEFISRGNVVDLAVGLIIGSAFTAIVTSLVNNIIMPAVGMITGGIDFSNLKIVLKEAVVGADGLIDPTTEVAIGYGTFISTIINFILVALSVFILIKVIGKFRRKKEEEPEPEPEPDPQIVLLTEIRDLLKEEKGE